GGTIAAPSSNCGCAGQVAEQPRKGPFQRMKGLFGEPTEKHGCYANTDISCSTWKQEYNFLFGSCRDFFGCPCFKTPEQLMSVSEGEYLGRTNPGLNRINKTYP
ncbi:MAG TPA: hypothetical protein VGP68_03340, partial [Gemmataceae bacterium]|nr:hypothetical protein [Gemmataceae bacterium]